MNTASRADFPVVVLFGPTGVGKTEFLSNYFSEKAEIINADSAQVYRYMNIGTAKPDSDCIRRLPHHMIDAADPRDEFSVADFVREADRLVPEILSRKAWPIISGGTAFYISNFIYGLPGTPPADPLVRGAVDAEYRLKGLGELYRELSEADPDYAVKVGPNDTQRIKRALEIIRTTGRKVSRYTRRSEPRSGYRFLVLGFEMPRELLYRRINERVERMFAEGLPGEYEKLLRSGYTMDNPGMKCIGYREFGAADRHSAEGLEEIKELIKRDTRRYAKRQMTFFRKIPQNDRFRFDEWERAAERIDDFFRFMS